MPGGYEEIYRWQAAKLAGADLTGPAPGLGLAVAGPGVVRVGLFGRDYLVDGTGVRPADGGPAHPSQLSLAAHYALSPGRGEPAYEFVPLDRLSGPAPGLPGGGRNLGRDNFGRGGAETSAGTASAEPWPGASTATRKPWPPPPPAWAGGTWAGILPAAGPGSSTPSPRCP